MSSSRAAIEADHPTQSIFTHYAVWGLLGSTLLYYLTYFNYGIDLDDEGFLLLNAASILHGQWPMADFYSYGPLSYFLLAAFFKLFGNNVLTERLMLLGLILLNVWLAFYCAKRLLPALWAWIPPAIYAFAPGPWYKVFFITQLLVSLGALIYFLERPRVGRALLLGLTAGLAMISRIEAGVIVVALFMGFLFIYPWVRDRPGSACCGTAGRGALRQTLAFEATFLLGLLIPIAVVLGAYDGSGKLSALLHNIDRYYNVFTYTAYLKTIPGLATTFSLTGLFTGRSLEMWVYAVAMLACVFNAGRYALAVFARRGAPTEAFAGFATAIFGLASMGYTLDFVWNSRMLSSFAIVYINYVDLLFFAHKKLTASGRDVRTASVVVTVGILAVLFYLRSFIVVQNYSGSYTTNLRGAMATVDVPVLKGIHTYAEQVGDIVAMRKLLADAPTGSSLVSMSEATTMGYISGLPNPTYYRLFITEFAPPGERERAIRTFERYRIRYFVARRSQFLEDGNHSSNLDAYAPQIKAYLLEKYRVIPLGHNFVLLERKANR